MRFRTILTLATLFLTCFTVAVWSASASALPADGPYDPATQKGYVSGKVSSVGAGSFSVNVKKSEDVVTLKFLVDSATKIDGKLAVGSMVTVDYRNDGAENIAVHVVVKSTVRSN
jgi:Domain of unknown function (DUF5666)